ncbi:MAG: hypothetical protein U9R21_02125, partial [Candidatus Thermoplasmatota archaeon]|nr:hypothetical protein [Candidatus Thermoplasmatota archaeon]
MKKILLRRIFCVLVAAFFVLPMNVVMIDDAKGDTEYLNVWREGESWDRSYDTNSGDPWEI